MAEYSKYFVVVDVEMLEKDRSVQGMNIDSYAEYLGISTPTYHNIKNKGYTSIINSGKIRKVMASALGATFNTSEFEKYGLTR